MFRTNFANKEHRKEQMYMSEKFIRAEEVAEVMEISVAYAYKIIRKLNQELSDKGFRSNAKVSATSSPKSCSNICKRA